MNPSNSQRKKRTPKIKIFAGLLIAVACALPGLVRAQPSETAGTSAKVVAPRVLFLDRTQIWSRYIDPKLSDEEKSAKKADLAQAMQPLIQQQMDQAGATLVVDKSAILAGTGGAEIDPQKIISALDQTHVPLYPTAPSLTTSGDLHAVNSHVLVVNKEAVSTRMRSEGIADIDEQLSSALKQIVADNHLDFILDRSAVVEGRNNFDATADVQYRLRGGHRNISQLQSAPARILVLNRSDVLALSMVGKSVTEQIGEATRAAESDFAPRANALRKDGEALKAKIPTLQPAEATQDVAAFKAREAALQAEIATRQQQIQDAVMTARTNIQVSLTPIVGNLMARHSGEILLDSEAIVETPKNLDITVETIAQLDLAMPSIELKIPAAVQAP